MATAVKNHPDTTATSLFDRPAAISLVGVIYVVGSLGIVFKLLPYLFWNVLGFNPESNANNVVVAFLLVAAATGLLVLGFRLLGPRSAHGTRAGIFVGVVGVLLILLITRWASLWFEHWAFYDHLFSPTVGALLTALVGLGLLIGGGFYFLQPQFEPFLQKFEDQGWFSATRYKEQQGKRVRWGTIGGLLLIAVAGIWTMYSHGTLRRLPVNWALNVPFTGQTEIDPDTFAQYRTWPPSLQQSFKERFHVDQKLMSVLDSSEPLDRLLKDQYKNEIPSLRVDRYSLRDFNTGELGQYVKVTEQGGARKFAEGDIVPKSEFNKEAQEIKSEERTEPKFVPLDPIRGTDIFATAQLLPNILYTLPILLLVASLWMAWRIVNYPAFADFLIATEAELNKVSWTTRRKLIQDTIVVLITVFLMAGYLFAMDQAWSHLLSWQPIRIIQIPKDTNESNKSVDAKPW